MELLISELFGVLFGFVLIYIVGKPYIEYRQKRKEGEDIQGEFLFSVLSPFLLSCFIMGIFTTIIGWF